MTEFIPENITNHSFRYLDICDQHPQNLKDLNLEYKPGIHYDELTFGDHNSTPVLHNSILFIPDLLTSEECLNLVNECEKRVTKQDDNPNSWLFGSEHATHLKIPFERHEIKDLSTSTQQFFQTILRERLLPFVSLHLPNVEASIWKNKEIVYYDPDALGLTTNNSTTIPATCKKERETSKKETETEQEQKQQRLNQQEFKYSESEPTINRYTKGGLFVPHRDELALTLNILLSNDFEGGGTQFWNETLPKTKRKNNTNSNTQNLMYKTLMKEANDKMHTSNIINDEQNTVNTATTDMAELNEQKESKHPNFCILPKSGVGCIFNGTIKHAGRAVTKGTRHLLVCSLSVIDKQPIVHSLQTIDDKKIISLQHKEARDRLKRRLIERRQKKLDRRIQNELQKQEVKVEQSRNGN